MKKSYISILLFTIAGLFVACSNDDDSTEPVNEEEIITTVILTFTPDGGGTAVVLTSRDLDGDGPNAPVVTVSGDFAANTNYNGTVQFLNETENPAEDITVEVNAEAEEHQVFYIPSTNLNLSFQYENVDSNGNPLGTLFSAMAGAASTGSLNLVLRHEPKKPNDGTLGDAGGETDVSVNFPLTIQ
ncbi:type 1 periplasmic binding fold superfamily protein [Altibacter sp.]|uniref:type 1 periplasmic binding fold superfamily protein n=1 Tax=Altibacter sp. TaxID=2024823 RepID=UPI000C8A39F1|nr:type 1 periplasmic binding fold superfamily protein [Altibacter sp.]MAP54826.1 type 1 periplasmic binding fold superfamily protein [Altibacter sp.]